MPLLLSAATEKCKLYPHEEKLRTAAQDLCHTVVDSLTVLISILLQTQKGSCKLGLLLLVDLASADVRTISVLTKSMQSLPVRESQEIENARNCVERSKTALNACIERLEQERLAFLTKTSTSILSETKATRQTMHDFRSDHGIMMRALYDIAAGQKEAFMTKSQVEDTMNNMFRQWLRQITASNMQTGLYRMVEENEFRRGKS